MNQLNWYKHFLFVVLPVYHFFPWKKQWSIVNYGVVIGVSYYNAYSRLGYTGWVKKVNEIIFAITLSTASQFP